MAQKVLVEVIDDIDGSEAEGTVLFSLDGANYEIDLSAENSNKLHASLAQYIEVARKIGKTTATAPARVRNRGRRSGGDGASADGNTEDVRAWAKQRGYKINDRGRIPLAIVADFEAAQAFASAAPTPAAEPKAEPEAETPKAATETPQAEAEPATVKSGPARRGGGKPATAKPATAAKAPRAPRKGAAGGTDADTPKTTARSSSRRPAKAATKAS